MSAGPTGPTTYVSPLVASQTEHGNGLLKMQLRHHLGDDTHEVGTLCFWMLYAL